MSTNRLICCLLFNLIFIAGVAITAYIFFVKFGGFGAVSVPDKIPDNVPNVPNQVPSVPSNVSSDDVLNNVKNLDQKWYYLAGAIAGIVLFASVNIYFLCCGGLHGKDSHRSSQQNRLEAPEQVELDNINTASASGVREGRVNRRRSVVTGANLPHISNFPQQISSEQLLSNIRARLNEEDKDWFDVLVEAKEEIKAGRNSDFVQQELQKAKHILSKSELLNSEEKNIIMQDGSATLFR